MANPVQNALSRAVARALAKGQVKKAARLEADAQTRRTLWKAIEEKAITQFNPHYVSPLTDADYGIPGVRILERAGYDKKTAIALGTRIHQKAWREMSAALRENANTPLPTIPKYPAEAKEALERFLREERMEGTMPDLLSTIELPDTKLSTILSQKYPTIKVGGFVVHKGQVFKLTPDGWSPQETIRRQYRLDDE